MPSEFIRLFKRIKHLKPDTYNNQRDVTAAIACDVKLDETIEEIVFKDENLILPKVTYQTSWKDSELNMQPLSFPTDEVDTVNIALDVIKIVRNPLLMMELLKPIDEELGKLLKKENIQFSKREEYLITSYSYFAPPPPPEDYVFWHKAELLNKILEKKEAEYGFKGIIKLIDFVNEGVLNKVIVENKVVFNENAQLTNVVHGSQTHRLMILALMSAAEKGLLSLKLKNTSTLTAVQFVEFLVKRRINDMSLWDFTIESRMEKMTPHDNNTYNMSHYHFSCRSPQTMTSLIICFPEFLPNLSAYLLDSFYKETYKIISRVKYNFRVKNGLNANQSCPIPDDRVYLYLIHFSPFDGKYVENFAPSISTVLAKPNYILLHKGIVKKVPLPTNMVEKYSSFSHFFKKPQEIFKKIAVAGDYDKMLKMLSYTEMFILISNEDLIKCVINGMYLTINNTKQKRDDIVKRYSLCIKLLIKMGFHFQWSSIFFDTKNLLKLAQTLPKELKLLNEFIQSKYYQLLNDNDKEKYSCLAKNEIIDEKWKPKKTKSNEFFYMIIGGPKKNASSELVNEFIRSEYFNLLNINDRVEYYVQENETKLVVS